MAATTSANDRSRVNSPDNLHIIHNIKSHQATFFYDPYQELAEIDSFPQTNNIQYIFIQSGPDSSYLKIRWNWWFSAVKQHSVHFYLVWPQTQFYKPRWIWTKCGSLL